MSITQESNYVMHCYKCGESSNLRMFPHRNMEGKMVGWIFVCIKHEDHELPETLELV